MAMINKDYLYTKIYSDIKDFYPLSNSMYIYGYSPEGRSHMVDDLRNKFPDISYVELEPVEEKDVIIDKTSEIKYFLRSSESIKSLFKTYKSDIVYIDASGLNNRICASLLNNALKIDKEQGLDIRVLYAEPSSYKIEQFKTEGVFNDLSEKIEGIEPLPGFASIIPDPVDVIFVAFLGFEGGRFTHLIENVQPPSDKITPVIGVPGYRIEYPFVALWGNRQPLGETKSWNNIKYIAANSLVDAYLLLDRIRKKSPTSKMILAPIGTKPHAIGAVLFAIKYPKQVEIVYDNPKRKMKRTDGVGLIVECKINTLLRNN